MENQIENKNQEDEISLIDLFAVLIRYRKMIIIVSIVVTFLAGLYLFVLPALVPSSSKKGSIVTYSVIVDRLPPTVEGSLGVGSISNLFMSNVKNMKFFSSVYKNHPIFSADGKLPESEEELNSLIVKILEDEEKIEVRNGPFGDTVDISVEVPSENIEKVKGFIADLVTQSNQKMDEYVLPKMENLKTNTRETIAIMEQQTSMLGNSTQNLQRMLLDLDSYMANLQEFLLVEDEPFITSVVKGRSINLLIVALAAFFVSVFIAFVLNAINNIKADPAASKVISDAWKAGK